MKVRYVGATFPRFTGKVFEVKRITPAGIVLSEGRIMLEGAGVWENVFTVNAEEVEEIEDYPEGTGPCSF